jgi:hypothetical protein
MTEDDLMGLRRDREGMKPFPKPKEVASAQ